jgi:hypothetical protein
MSLEGYQRNFQNASQATSFGSKKEVLWNMQDPHDPYDIRKYFQYIS